MSWTPPPGTIGLTYLYGLRGYRASFGQRLLGESSSLNHAFIVLDHRYVMETWPDGARIARLTEFEDDYVVFGTPVGLPPSRLAAIAQAARSLDGVSYGLSDYALLTLHRSGWRGRWADRLSDSARLLPAQFVVESYRRAGLILLPHRAPHDASLEQVGRLFHTPTAWERRVPISEFA